MYTTIKQLAESQASDVQGTSIGTRYGLQPVLYLKEIVDAAQNALFFANFVRTVVAGEGQHTIVIPKRTAYEGRSGLSFDTSERTDADISWTTMDNLSNIYLTPTIVLSGYAITNYALRTNAVNLLQAAKDELSYGIGDRLDYAVCTAIGDAASTTSATTGMQMLYGGDATSDNTLATGDIITTDIVATAAKLLQTRNKQYRANTGNGGGYGAIQTATVTGNPWQNTAAEPFVLFIGPAQEETFRKDSQFVNASEYGSDRVVRNGEIGEYLGIKIVVTNNVEQVASGSEGPDAETANAGARMTRCILIKAFRAAAIGWGQKPTLKVFDHPNRDQTRISLVSAYATDTIHDDAIVSIDVADA